MPRKKKKETKEPAFTPVHIPAAVADQGDAADAKILELSGEPKVDAPIDDGIVDAPAVPAPATPAEPIVPPAIVPPAQDSPSEWESKYKVLQGKYNAEIPELRTAIGNLQNLVSHQSSLMEQMKGAITAPAAPAVPAVPAEDFPVKPLNTEDFNGYGEDIVFMAKGFNQLIEVNKRQADMINSLSTGTPGAPVDNSRLERVESFVQETAQDTYRREMDSRVPRWGEVIYSDDFTSWLPTVDPVSGYRFQAMFDYAQKNFRYEQAQSILQRYANERGIDISTAGVAPGQPAIVDNTRQTLSDLAMPAPSTGPDGGSDPNKTVTYPTQEDVSKASAMYAQGKIKIDEFNRISDGFMTGLKANQER